MTDSRRWLERLVHATNSRDIDAVVACFAPDYVNVTPAHPARGFVGADQVRRNWTQIFAGVIVFEVEDDLARKATFFLEPVDDGPGTVDDAVRTQVLR